MVDRSEKIQGSKTVDRRKKTQELGLVLIDATYEAYKKEMRTECLDV